MYCSNCGNPCTETDNFCSNCPNPCTFCPPARKGSLLVPILILLLLSAIGIALYFAIPYSNASDTLQSENSWFYADNGTLYFDKSRYTGPSELTVPDELFGQQVRALSEDCFENCTFLTGVVLPDSLEEIGVGAFRGCTGLRGIRIPESVVLIGGEAFYGCTELEAISLSSSLDQIGIDAFDQCDQLHYIMFSGFHRDWIKLYDEFINPYATVFCDDGSYFQGQPVQ